MKSLLPIDESWTVRTFTRAVGQASSILRHNNLPDTSSGAKPFATLLEQQSNLIGNLTAGIKNVGDTEIDFEYKKEDQSKAIKSSLADDIKAVALASLSPSGFIQHALTGLFPGFLSVPRTLIDTVTPVVTNLQKEILDTSDTDLPKIQQLLQTNIPEIQIPSRPTGRVSSESDWYWRPRGEVMIQIEGEEPMEIPAWPEEIADNVAVTWSQEMTTFQFYENQNTFKQSGPRTMNLHFKLHRAMWTGNQDSGDCERLVAYIQSACYPDYNTQASEPPRVLFTAGKSVRIYGIVTSMQTKYSGPIGPDTKYDCVDIDLSITEESQNVLSTQAVRAGLAGWG